MNTVISREVAKSAILAELDRQPSEPKAWEEMHLFCAIEAVRRGDYDIALKHICNLRSEPCFRTAAMTAPRPLHTRARLRAMLERL